MEKKPDILKRIIDHKHQELVELKHKKPLDKLTTQLNDLPETRPFAQSLTDKIQNKMPAIIAEIKKASPSKGVIREDFDVKQIATAYEQAGASCISVLTDKKFFHGSNNYLQQAKQASALPILRKDFIIDPYQIYESRVIGADCILLIVAALTDPQLTEFHTLAQQLTMDTLIEVHNEEELARALAINNPLIGINNRDLHTFSIRLHTTLDLLQYIPKSKIVVTESGINNHHDIKLMHDHNVHAFLMGEVLMLADDPGEKLKQLFADWQPN